MKKFSVALFVLVVGLFLLFPSFSFAQKSKKSKTTSKKQVSKVSKSSISKTETLKTPKSLIVSKWRATFFEGGFKQEEGLIEFFKDGSYRYSNLDDPSTTLGGGKYELTNNGRRLTSPTPLFLGGADLTIEGDNMTLQTAYFLIKCVRQK